LTVEGVGIDPKLAALGYSAAVVALGVDAIETPVLIVIVILINFERFALALRAEGESQESPQSVSFLSETTILIQATTKSPPGPVAIAGSL